MARRPISRKKTKPANTYVKPRNKILAIEQLELRWLMSITSAFQRVSDPIQSQPAVFGYANVYPNTGTFQIIQPLDFDISPGTNVGRNPALLYDSNTVAPRPIIEAAVTTNASLGLPSSIQAQLTFNGNTQSWVTFSTTGHSAGDTYTIDTQDATALTSTGAYAWSLTVKVFYSGSTETDTTSGTAYAVVRSALAAGWTISSLDRLVPVTGGLLYVYGSGGFRFFSGSGPSYTSPANDFGTLVQNLDGSYTYAAVDDTKYNFQSSSASPSGALTSVVDPDSQTVTYTY
jgi:hypothetical protein